MPDTTDHEQILLIRQDIANLKDSQADFHREVRESFNELKNDTISDIAILKKDKADRKDVEAIQSHVNELQGIINNKVSVRVENLEATRNDFRDKLKMSGGIQKFIGAAILFLIGIMLWHIIGYHI